MSVKSILHNRVAAPCRVLKNDIQNHNADIGFSRFVSSVARGTPIGTSAGDKIQKQIYDKLLNEFNDTLIRYQEYDLACEYDSKAPIWVFWMQGYDSAPTIVKKCIDSIKASTDHPVNLITSENISEYYSFPDYIKEKYAREIITHAQFSDILRMTLLDEYGGLWIDATIFIPNQIPESVFQFEFFTCKRDIKAAGYVSEYRWTSFLNGCQKGCIIQKAAKDLFFEYWKKNNYLIDYLLVDYVLLLIYRNIPKAKELIDNLPYNNPQIEELQNRMNQVYNGRDYQELINQSETDFFKLSWRMNFEKEKDGRRTYYGYFLSQ